MFELFLSILIFIVYLLFGHWAISKIVKTKSNKSEVFNAVRAINKHKLGWYLLRLLWFIPMFAFNSEIEGNFIRRLK